jgi:hypothetical protein
MQIARHAKRMTCNLHDESIWYVSKETRNNVNDGKNQSQSCEYKYYVGKYAFTADSAE